MLRVIRLAALIIFSATFALPVGAQESQILALQRNIEIFSGVLEEVLDLTKGNGLFGVSLGGVENTYLLGQGVVLEVRTPLANSFNRMNLVSLNSAMQSLQARSNPFEAIALSSASSKAPSLASTAEPLEASSFYSDMMEKIANVDYSLAVSNAIRQASESARSLRSLGSIDDSDYTQLQADIEMLRTEMQENMQGLRQFEAELRKSAVEAISSVDIEAEAQNKLDDLMIKIEPLRARAIAKANELRERSEVAELAHIEQWRQEVVELESRLYQAMCDYGSTLRGLPEKESVSIILTGLGEQGEDQRRTNKVHILNMADLLACQAGDITVVILQQRSTQYSY
jgi:hypothetical protein